jgi:non-specific serine/threonine protein kinase
MYELTISPRGQLILREAALETPERKLSKALIEAYQTSSAQGMLYSASAELDAVLPPSFDFARGIGRLYLAHLCKTATGQPGEPIPELPPPDDELEHALLQAPPLLGLEYLTADVLSTWWQELDDLIRTEIVKHPGGAQGYLRERNPHWRFVGRVTLHLAENKRNPTYPFAFLATFANGLTPQGKVKHERLSQALQQYAGARKRQEMLALLVPLSKAAESSELIQGLVDSGDIYQPLAWSARQAYDFLKTIPVL